MQKQKLRECKPLLTSSQVVVHGKLGLELALWNFEIHTLLKPYVIPSSYSQASVLGFSGDRLWVGDWSVESSLGSVTNISTHGGLAKAVLARGRSWAVIRSQRPHPVLWGAQKLRWSSRVILPWGKGGGSLYPPRTVQSLDMSCQSEEGMVLCEVALLNRGQFLEDNSSESPLLSTLAATGGKVTRLLRGRICVVR